MTDPIVVPVDPDALRSAHWQGVVTTKLDQLTATIEKLAADKNESHADLSARIDSLESTRDKATGALFGAAAIGGLLGGGLSSLITFLVS